MNLDKIRKSVGIIGESVLIEEMLGKISQVANTDISVLITGSSGSGKEMVAKAIHKNSKRKFQDLVTVNCAAIPSGIIESELFGHKKGSFTGADENRKGYFESADKGTIFLDEIGELPMSSQARLLRVLESGEYMKVGSSMVQKTNVRIIAATNVKIQEAVKNGKFREDLYYRLNTISIQLPALRERKEDIHLLFKKFASDFAEKYNTPPIFLTEEANEILTDYRWPGNIRQLRNFVAQLSVIEKERTLDANKINNLLPKNKINTPIIFEDKNKADLSEREILYKVLFDMKKDLNELKKITFDLIKNEGNTEILGSIKSDIFDKNDNNDVFISTEDHSSNETIQIEESLSLFEHEKKLIEKSLIKHKGKRKDAAAELGISERTLYRKLKEFGL